MSLLQNSNAISDSSYNIANSLRFQSASSQYLSRTPASASNQKTWTYSTWVKRGSLGSIQSIFDSVETYIQFNASNIIEINLRNAATNYIWTTSQVFRDPSAWYHIVLAVDTTQATATDRMKLYINGSQVTAFASSATIPQNTDTRINSTSAHYIGSYTGTTYYLDGYQTEINFVNAQQLTPSSFGETNSTTGQWIAKSYSGSYGTNGFFLKFANGTSTTTLGSDSSGNSNNWTLNNFTRSAGVSDCWMYDVPSGNGSSVGGTQPNSNYAVMNPLSKGTNTTITNANLYVANSSGTSSNLALSSIGMTSGKWYAEVTATSTDCMVGIFNLSQSSGSYVGENANGWGYYRTGSKFNAGTSTSYGATYTTNDVIGIAFDADAGTLTFYKNNVSQGTAFSSLTNSPYYFAVGNGSSSSAYHVNFGQRSFAYTPPSGFKALCTANLPASTIVKGNQFMDATLWTGTAAALNVTNAGGFSPDLVWIKGRNTTFSNVLYDTIRGATNYLVSNSTAAETASAGSLTAFNSNGFSVGSDAFVNGSGALQVAWQWDAGSSTVTNTNGTISSQVRANPTAGVSVVTYTNPASGTFTVGHGLGVAPAMMILKSSNQGSTNWVTYHKSLGNTQAIYLNLTNAATTNTTWNNTSPTSTVFTGTVTWLGGSAYTYVAYCFSEIAGFSKFGSYTGNGSTDGTFVYTGFTPKFVMIKGSSTNTAWFIYDSVRNTYNLTTQILYPNLSDAETTSTSYQLDLLSNGFKLRGAGTGFNGSGETIIYAAFASNPFSSSNAK